MSTSIDPTGLHNSKNLFDYGGELRKGREYMSGGDSHDDTVSKIITESQKRAELRSARMMATMVEAGSRNEAKTAQTTIARDNVQTNRTNSTNIAGDSLRQVTNARQVLNVQ